MMCAPVLLVTLNRYKHLSRCIDSLRKNKMAKDTDLYIGLDYPPDQRYEEGYRLVKKYLEKEITGFHKVNIIKQLSNKGVYGNSLELKNAAYEKYDKYIYSEDDNEFSPNYLEYMNRCFEKYENDDTILAVSGYNYPIEREVFDGNVYKCGTYFAAYGYGIWKRKEDEMRKKLNMPYFRMLYNNRMYMSKLKRQSRNQYVNMIKGMLKYTPDLINEGQIREVDLAYGLYMVASGKKMVYPVISKVRNWGYDGSGVNCGEVRFRQNGKLNHRNYQFEKQTVDIDKSFGEILEDTKTTQEQLNRLLNAYFFIPNKEYVKTKSGYWFSRIVGLENTQRIFTRN